MNLERGGGEMIKLHNKYNCNHRILILRRGAVAAGPRPLHRGRDHCLLCDQQADALIPWEAELYIAIQTTKDPVLSQLTCIFGKGLCPGILSSDSYLCFFFRQKSRSDIFLYWGGPGGIMKKKTINMHSRFKFFHWNFANVLPYTCNFFQCSKYEKK